MIAAMVLDFTRGESRAIVCGFSRCTNDDIHRKMVHDAGALAKYQCVSRETPFQQPPLVAKRSVLRRCPNPHRGRNAKSD